MRISVCICSSTLKFFEWTGYSVALKQNVYYVKLKTNTFLLKFSFVLKWVELGLVVLRKPVLMRILL